MEFEVIKVSEANVDWEEEDREYLGVIPGFVAGFNFEIEKNGVLDYMSAVYTGGTPKEFIEEKLEGLGWDYFDTVRSKGYTPTGRAVFRGYSYEYYDTDFMEWCVEEAHEEAVEVANNMKH